MYTVKLRGGGMIRTDGVLMYHHVFRLPHITADTIVGIRIRDEGKEMYIPIVCIKEIIEDGDTIWEAKR